MYFIIIDPERLDNPVNGLVEELVLARRRGVEVKVVMEDSRLNQNRLAYRKLKDNEIDVSFDTAERLMHIKGLSIDDRYLVIGSTNWSTAAMTRNYELSALLDSPREAAAVRAIIDSIELQKSDAVTGQREGVKISADFLLSPKQGRRLLKAQADKQLDIYMELCRIQQDTGKAYLVIDYDSLAVRSGYSEPNELGKYRNVHHYYYERVHRALKKLKIYGLIDYKKGAVTMKANTTQKGPAVTLSYAFWEKSYAGTLSMRAKYLYLIALHEADKSTRQPEWFRSQKDISKIYGISDTTISEAMQELEKAGLIEIKRDRPTPPDFANRNANVYRMKPLK